MQKYTIIYHNNELNHHGSIEVIETGIHAAIKKAKEGVSSLLGQALSETRIYQLYQTGRELPLWESLDCPPELKRL